MSWKMIQIPSEKMENLSEHIEKALRYAGKAMQCIEEYIYGNDMGERGNYGRGGSYGNRSYDYGSREEDWMRESMDERRRRDSRGRYM